MKKNKLNLLIAASLAVAFATSCAKSSAESKEDPAILQFAATQIANANAVQLDNETGVCLANIASMNSCIGGASQGEGYSGELCSKPDTARAILSASTFATCISAKITSTNCTISSKKFLDKAAAEAGGFKECTGGL